MSDHSVVHSTFSLERTYDAGPERVFGAWADPAAKARWFAGPAEAHELDFRVGGRELTRGRSNSGAPVEFNSMYRDIVPGQRIVYASTLSADGTVSTVSITTIEIEGTAEGTRLLLTEQATFLDGREDPRWRQQGTSDWLDALGPELHGS
jgi:uncharacterized protein YndB with AHSA1/START domain